jgi:hypothetical protein
MEKSSQLDEISMCQSRSRLDAFPVQDGRSPKAGLGPWPMPPNHTMAMDPLRIAAVLCSVVSKLLVVCEWDEVALEKQALSSLHSRLCDDVLRLPSPV